VISIPLAGLVTVTRIALERDRNDGVLVAAAIPGRVLLRRFTGNGVWDSQFGTNGLATNPNADGFLVKSLAVGRNGDILISGAAGAQVAYQPALLKLNSMGLPVTAFGTAGVQRYPSLSLGTGNTDSLLVEDDRVIVSVASGSSVTSSDFNSNDSTVAAMDLQSGQLRTEFGAGGSLTWDWGLQQHRGHGPVDAQRTRWLHRLWSCDAKPLAGPGSLARGHHGRRKTDTSVGYQGRRLIAGTNDATCAGLLRMSDGRLAVAARDGGEAVVMFFDR
jgi:hypothetical protein